MLMELPEDMEKHPQFISRPRARFNINAPIYDTSRILLNITVPGIQNPTQKKIPIISSSMGRTRAVKFMRPSGKI
jgi:hypothetical protein